MNNLKDTKGLMVSPNYKERFKAEYWQLKIRFESLKRMCNTWDNGKLDFTPTCKREIYDRQLTYMKGYLDVLEERARIEGVNLDE